MVGEVLGLGFCLCFLDRLLCVPSAVSILRFFLLLSGAIRFEATGAVDDVEAAAGWMDGAMMTCGWDGARDQS